METRGTDSNEGAKRSQRGNRCGGCCSKLVGIMCSNLGVCLLVLLYTILGAIIFTSIEGGPYSEPLEEPSMQHVTLEEAADSTLIGGKVAAVLETHQTLQKLRQETVERLWTITESLNILYRDNWTRVAEKELLRFGESLLVSTKDENHHLIAASRDSKTRPHQWSFAGSFLYSLTVITTIGYGSIAPHTGLGKVVTILYALLGIPLMLLYLSSVGDLLSRFLKWIWSKLCCCRRKKKQKSPVVPLVRSNHLSGAYSNLDTTKVDKWKDLKDEYSEDNGAIPVTLCLVLMVAYMAGGAAIFSYTHNWTYLHAIYFCFSSLTTIGFGDLNPGLGAQSQMGLQLCLIGTAIYLLIGMALIATCFNLIQEQVTARNSGLRRLGNMTGHPQFHFDET